MSNNTLLNALVALLEDRSRDARSMLRSPELKLNVGQLTQRLETAIMTREAKSQVAILKQVLGSTLRIEAPEENREAYLSGVTHVETIIDNLIKSLES